MLTINPVNFNKYNKQYISFGENKTNNQNKVGVMTLDKNSSTKINFQKDLYESKNADMVQSNPIKALGYNIIKAYNILCTPRRQVNQSTNNRQYIHIPYMA